MIPPAPGDGFAAQAGDAVERGSELAARNQVKPNQARQASQAATRAAKAAYPSAPG